MLFFVITRMKVHRVKRLDVFVRERVIVRCMNRLLLIPVLDLLLGKPLPVPLAQPFAGLIPPVLVSLLQNKQGQLLQHMLNPLLQLFSSKLLVREYLGSVRDGSIDRPTQSLYHIGVNL